MRYVALNTLAKVVAVDTQVRGGWMRVCRWSSYSIFNLSGAASRVHAHDGVRLAW